MPHRRPQYAAPTAPPNELPELLTVQEAAKVLTVSVTRVRHLYGSRFLAFYKIGGSIRFAKGDLLEFLAAQRVEARPN